MFSVINRYGFFFFYENFYIIKKFSSLAQYFFFLQIANLTDRSFCWKLPNENMRVILFSFRKFETIFQMIRTIEPKSDSVFCNLIMQATDCLVKFNIDVIAFTEYVRVMHRTISSGKITTVCYNAGPLRRGLVVVGSSWLNTLIKFNMFEWERPKKITDGIMKTLRTDVDFFRQEPEL